METRQPSAPRPPLDQLQAALNLVLESTGHVFAEANRGGDKDRAAAAAARLKAVAPTANDAFHNALDELEAQLITARWVLKRDLAALQQKQTLETPTLNGTKSDNDQPKDIDMADASPLPSTELPDAAPDTALTLNDDPIPAEEPKEEPSKPTTDLSIDTTAKPDDTSQPEPTTGMSTMDFDSLFNDPASATGSNSLSATPKPDEPVEEAPPAPAAEPTPPVIPPSSNETMPSSLLAGLESYANAAGDATIDLSTPIPSPDTKPVEVKTEPPPPPPPLQQQQEQPPAVVEPEQQDGDVKRDTTFDDIMNFADFDFSSFGMGDGANLEDGEGTTFDDAFFDVE